MPRPHADAAALRRRLRSERGARGALGAITSVLGGALLLGRRRRIPADDEPRSAANDGRVVPPSPPRSREPLPASGRRRRTRLPLALTRLLAADCPSCLGIGCRSCDGVGLG